LCEKVFILDTALKTLEVPMKIALYPSHHCLPFWHKPRQPELIFDSGSMADWTLEGSHGEDIPVHTSWMWPILQGLSAIDMPLLAHVSMNFVDGKIHYSKRVWVQITTLPTTIDDRGIPLVVGSNNEALVDCLWGWDNQTYSPQQLPEARDGSEEDYAQAEYWKNLFEGILRKTKGDVLQEALERILKAQRAQELYALIS
jgi:hypothetical protein